MKLLTSKNPKIEKSMKQGHLTWGMHLLPGKNCARASKGCLSSCLNLSGRGRMLQTQLARARKSKLFWEDPLKFVEILKDEMQKAIVISKNKGYEPIFRLNLTSDIPWELYGIPQEFPNVQMMDYTKYHDRHPPENYHLTFSKSEANNDLAKKWLARGGNVAVVFKDMPSEYWGHSVINGDNHDLRFLDPKGVIVGLKAKGKAKKDDSGFVVRLPLAS